MNNFMKGSMQGLEGVNRPTKTLRLEKSAVSRMLNFRGLPLNFSAYAEKINVPSSYKSEIKK